MLMGPHMLSPAGGGTEAGAYSGCLEQPELGASSRNSRIATHLFGFPKAVDLCRVDEAQACCHQRLKKGVLRRCVAQQRATGNSRCDTAAAGSGA